MTNSKLRDETERAFYAWLSAEHKAAADAHFGLFYQGFSRTLQALVRRRYRSLSQHLVDDAVAEAMLKMLELFGEPRRRAIATVAAVLAQLQPLALGDLHCRRVRVWKGRVAQYRLDVLDFARAESTRGSMRLERIEAFNTERHTLLEGGHGLVNEVRMQSDGQAGACDDVEKAVANFITTLRDRLNGLDAAGVDRKLGLDGASVFVMSMDELIMALRQLRVLTTSYAVAVCMNELKKLFRSAGRDSRVSRAKDRPRPMHTAGDSDKYGTDAPQSEVSDDEDVGDKFSGPCPDQGHEEGSMFRFSQASGLDTDESEPSGPLVPSENAAAYCDADAIVDPSAGPEQTVSHQELYRLLLAALEEPIRTARQRLAAAEKKRDRARAQDQVDRAVEDHELDVALLLGWLDDEGQEEMAARLDITRNQVRYGLKRMAMRIIEFCAARNIAYGEDLRAIAEGRTLRQTRAASGRDATRALFTVIDGDRSSDGGEV